MVNPPLEARDSESGTSSLSISSFGISGGIFGAGHKIRIPTPPSSGKDPGILIISGPNGSGKTTILRMIFEVLSEMNFDTFRKIPFADARFEFSDGRVLTVQKVQNENFPLLVKFGDVTAQLFKQRRNDAYSAEQKKQIDQIRNVALSYFHEIKFELLDIHRSLALRQSDADEDEKRFVYYGAMPPETRKPAKELMLSERVRNFLRDAQLNYRRFFAADELELLPRIVNRFHTRTQDLPKREDLLKRVSSVQARFPVMKRFGLQTDDADLTTLSTLLQSDAHANDPHSITLVEAYVEMQENRHKARELVATRLLEFEQIMDEFLQGKSVRINTKEGLQILAGDKPLRETDLSSGEYHFLYMMVAALLCQRSGTIIAIDEPELSLHVAWQRKLVRALARCAAGATPVFIFATHSAAIAAEHADQEYSLSSFE